MRAVSVEAQTNWRARDSSPRSGATTAIRRNICDAATASKTRRVGTERRCHNARLRLDLSRLALRCGGARIHRGVDLSARARTDRLYARRVLAAAAIDAPGRPSRRFDCLVGGCDLGRDECRLGRTLRPRRRATAQTTRSSISLTHRRWPGGVLQASRLHPCRSFRGREPCSRRAVQRSQLGAGALLALPGPCQPSPPRPHRARPVA